MNIIKGQIDTIQVNGNLSLVKVRAGEIRLTAILIDTPATAQHLQQDTSVNVIFKETEVILGRGETNKISMQNQIPGAVESIESGQLLSKVILKTSIGNITSIITSNAVRQLELQLGSPVTAMIKTNEMMLSV